MWGTFVLLLMNDRIIMEINESSIAKIVTMRDTINCGHSANALD